MNQPIKFQGHVKALELGIRPGDVKITIQGGMSVCDGCDLVLNVQNFVIMDYIPGQPVEITVAPMRKDDSPGSGMI